MAIYAGIDEAGYGPMFGPLTVGCVVMDVASDRHGGMLWDDLSVAVCRMLSERKVRGGMRIAVNDSKKLHTKALGIRHLELGVLSFGKLCGCEGLCVGSWLNAIGNAQVTGLPWYSPTSEMMASEAGDEVEGGGGWAWAGLPCVISDGELAIQTNSLKRAMGHASVRMVSLRTAVVFEDRFNEMTAMSRSKASTSFTFVAEHLDYLWQVHAGSAGGVRVVVDRQSGRQRYRELLASVWPSASLQIVEERPDWSGYRLRDDSRVMEISFEVGAEQEHMPVALASMSAKYARELLMHRFQAFFQKHAPDIKPTAGYGQDAKRFWEEIEPRLSGMGIEGKNLRRMA